ncbi:AHH domain-containing protein [Archangium violaceum]|uniref:AHH domain-containing protein n=1 Tax=Archangium violaceum TaxID=83451 RepID=UPI00194EC875|nr:AHH domain-containing protein [Archangium violaceum]QRN95757.1 AHH domain-containing protein [Archangium violaceum]
MGEGVRDAAEALLTDPLFVTGVIVSMTLYMAAWAMPEPLFSKATAATLTFVLMMSFTVAEIRNAAVVLLRLERDARKARTLAELEAVAGRFGRAAGATLLRILVMVAGWTVGKALPPVPRGGMGGRLMAPSGPRLPDGSLISSGQVVADGSLVMTGIASGTAASAARQESLCSDGSEDDGVPGHHIATIRNRASNVRGGPWTLVFEPLFKKAGMSLDAPENIVRVRGHKGPHSEEYHSEVFRRISTALRGCNGVDECRRVLSSELKALAAEICTPGTVLSELLMRKR